MTNFAEFLDYCESFYLGPDSLYPILDLTREELALATLTYLDQCQTDDTMSWGEGDSLDRERVRVILFDIRHDNHMKALDELITDAEKALREEFSTVSA